MFADFVQDDSLRDDAIIIDEITRPLESEHNSDLEQQSESTTKQLEWYCNRCLGGQDSWWGVVAEILCKRHDKDLFRRLRLAPPCNPPVPFDAPYIQDDIRTLEKAIVFSNALASRYVWSQMLFRYTLPHGIAFLLSRSAQRRKDGMILLKQMVEAVVSAQDKPSQSKDLQEILADIGWADESLPIEIMALLMQSDYDPSCMELRRLAMRYYSGSSTTAHVLERCFAHLTDVFARHSKNKKGSPFAVWFYASCSPYTRKENSGMEQSLPTKSEWSKCMPLLCKGSKSIEAKLFNHSFKPSSTPLPSVHFPVSSTAIRKKKWRTCGPNGHYNSVAAMAYLLHDAPSDFANVDMAWAG